VRRGHAEATLKAAAAAAAADDDDDDDDAMILPFSDATNEVSSE